MTTILDDATRARLSGISTATLTTALFKRGLRNVFLQGPQRINPAPRQMVGPAFTLRYIPAREDIDVLKAFEDRNHPQRKGVEECPPGHVMVIDSRGDAHAASAGGILLTRLMHRGVAGVVTDGGFRDTPEIAGLDFPAYHKRPSAPTNLIHHHAADLNLPVACGEVAVYPGDVMVGDNEGVVCIPAYLAAEIAAETFEQTVYEDFVVEEVRNGTGLFGLYPLLDPQISERFARWRDGKGR
ncbi:MAG TPA: ribonuclease activity regulator RraA [Ramlibacter sp.]|jgi:regulator of RNase E activity RraA